MAIYLIFGIVLVALIALVILWFVHKKKKARAEAGGRWRRTQGGGAGTEEVDALIKEAERRLAASKQGTLADCLCSSWWAKREAPRPPFWMNAGVEPELLSGLVLPRQQYRAHADRESVVFAESDFR